jgi:hypothetical protein
LAWWPLVFFPADSTNFHTGFTSTIVIGCLTIIAVLVVWYFERRMAVYKPGEIDVFGTRNKEEMAEEIREVDE